MELFLRFLLLISSIYHKGGDCGSVQTSASLNATIGSSVDLTCTYTLSSNDTVYSGSIAWQTKRSGSSTYENIALFSPPGEGNNSFTTTESAMNLKDRAELLDVTSTSSDTFRVVMRVNEVQCLDEKEYRCFVSFNNPNTGPQTDTAITSLTVQAPAEQPYDIPDPVPSNIEENMNVTLFCAANVGKPPGKIKWWRYRDQINAPFLVAESSEIPAIPPGVCVYNVTFSIQPLVTKDDDQSVWRCSVDNELLTGSPDQDKPNRETARINVFYKVGVPKITKTPDTPNSQYSVGSSVSLTCTANGNPNPSTNVDKNINKYVWTFKANPGDNATELSSSNGILSLKNLAETDTGTYTCTAFNGFNGKCFNNSFDEQLQIGGDCGTVQTSASLNATIGSSVDLTCTYTLESGDTVYSGLIAWQAKKTGSSTFETIATFSPPGGGNNSFTNTQSAQNLHDRAELLDVTSISSDTFRVVMRVKEVQCLDEKEYQCSVTFISTNTGPLTKTAVTFLKVQGGDCGTVQTSASLNATIGSSVDLTCTYTLESGDTVYSGLIAWQAKKTGSSTFETIATFSPPGGGNNSFTNTQSAQNLHDRAELLDVTSISSDTFRVVMRVKEVQCLDEKEYQCSVIFISTNTGPLTKTAVTFLKVQAPAEQPYSIPVPDLNNIEENMTINLSCTANVGKPPGKIKWWRYRDQINAPFFVAESSELPAVQPGVCVYNVTFSIQPLVTKDDDQSVWRCSVDNELLTSSPDQDKPNQETDRINVFYKVGVPKITKIPNDSNSKYSVGSSVILTCVADGYPSPSTNIDKDINKYVWAFKANPGDNATELSSNNGVLSLNNLEETDTGTYTCTAFNGFNGKLFNNSFDQKLYVEAASEIVQLSSVQTSAITSATMAASVDLTFNYTLGHGDSVYNGFIVLQAKKTGTSDYENVAIFSPPGRGNNSFTTTESAMILKDRAELMDVTAVGLDTFCVVTRVLDVRCLDEKEYRFSVTFLNSNTGPQTKTAFTLLSVKAPAEQPYDIPDPVPRYIEENMNMTLTCTANVGKPPGKIKWWRYRDQINAPIFVAESSEIPAVQPGVCVYNVTFSIQPLVTKDDDQSVWRCSVDNELLTSSPDQDKPNQETARINVFYKVGVPKITKTPDIPNSQYSVGSSVTLTCIAKGNPSPSTNNEMNKYVWTFKANPGDNATELSSNNGTLILSNLEEIDTGTYTCTAFNGFNGKSFSNSFDEQLQIGEAFEIVQISSVQVSAITTARIAASVDLTFNYTLGTGDSVYSGLIVWQTKKSGTSDFENIATFSPPGRGNSSFTASESAMNLKDRAELLDVIPVGLNSFRAVMRVFEVHCSDEKEYRSSVTFFNLNTGPQTKTAVTFLTVQAPAEQPYDIPDQVPSNIEENMNFTLSCTANVGKPPGKIKWWRYRDQIDAPVLVAESSEIPTQPGVCVYNVTFSIQPLVTKDDDQSVWRCSVDNELLTGSPDQDKPNQKTDKINVFYKVGIPNLSKYPNVLNSQYSVGSSVTLTCVAKGNPSPITNNAINKYVWTFKANPGDNSTELSSNNGVLILNNLEETDTGTYTCTAFNGFNGKSFNSSIDDELYVVKTTTTPFSTASTPEWSTEYSVAQNQETEALSTENSDTQNKEEVKTTTTSFSTASTPEWSTEYSVAQNQETEVNTSLVPTTTPPLTKEPTGNQGTHSQSVEITTTVLTTTAHFESPAGPAGNSDTERQGSDDDGLSMGATVVLMVSILVIVIAILVVLKVWYNKLQRASVSRVEATIPDFSVFMDENNKPFTFHRSPMIVTNQY